MNVLFARLLAAARSKGAGGDLTRFSPPEIPTAVSIFKTAYSRPDTGSRTVYAYRW
jgi:hypothetical protein